MKNIFYVLLVSLVSFFTIGSSSVYAHCGDAEKHAADKTKEEKKEKDKDA